VKGLKTFDSDIGSIGKHYLIKCISLPSVKRHYTTSNCMRKHVHDEYIRIIKQFLDEHKGVTNLTTQEMSSSMRESMLNMNRLFDEADGSELVITAKNYNMPRGLSRLMHD
jgi:hypothetical protein